MTQAALAISIPMQDLPSLAQEASGTLDVLLREAMAAVRATVTKEPGDAQLWRAGWMY